MAKLKSKTENIAELELKAERLRLTVKGINRMIQMQQASGQATKFIVPKPAKLTSLMTTGGFQSTNLIGGEELKLVSAMISKTTAAGSSSSSRQLPRQRSRSITRRWTSSFNCLAAKLTFASRRS